jgi:hypothetical protein
MTTQTLTCMVFVQHHGSHPLGDRARKLDQGILVIRCELSLHMELWFSCTHCILCRSTYYLKSEDLSSLKLAILEF